MCTYMSHTHTHTNACTYIHTHTNTIRSSANLSAYTVKRDLTILSKETYYNVKRDLLYRSSANLSASGSKLKTALHLLPKRCVYRMCSLWYMHRKCSAGSLKLLRHS